MGGGNIFFNGRIQRNIEERKTKACVEWRGDRKD